MSSDDLKTYEIAGKRYAARSLAQALYAYRVAVGSKAPDKLREAPRLARTQPYPDNTGTANPVHPRGGSQNGR